MPYLFPYACFECRRSFKREPLAEKMPCPNCGAMAVRLSRKFKAPRATAKKQWEKVKYLVEHGFLFESIDHEGRRVRYPKTLAEAEAFVKKYGEKVTLEAAERARLLKILAQSSAHSPGGGPEAPGSSSRT